MSKEIFKPAPSAGFNSAAASWEDHRAAFFKSLQESDRATMQTVLKKYPEAVDWQDPKGNTPLHTAFDKRDLDTFKFLLEKGANPNQQAQLTGLRKLFSVFPDPYILEKAVKTGEKPYIIPLLQYNAWQHNRTNGERAPKAVRFEITDLLKRADKIREEFLEQQRGNKPAAAPAPQPAATEGEQHLEVLKPAKVQRRAPNAPA
ncbi:MAG: ankyrin repeat domain-containing protein [Alphaproteobacteria bacterium]|nr:ankyrin repeat domain-containing protein [Alphaproteobacteria bacterium]